MWKNRSVVPHQTKLGLVRWGNEKLKGKQTRGRVKGFKCAFFFSSSFFGAVFFRQILNHFNMV